MKIAIIVLTAIFSSTALANQDITAHELNVSDVQVEKIEVDGKLSSNMKSLFKEFKYNGPEETSLFMIAKSK